MSLESKIMPSISSMINFIKTQVKTSLVEANSKNIIDLEKDDLTKITNLIDMSIESAYVRGMNEVTMTINNLQKSKK